MEAEAPLLWGIYGFVLASARGKRKTGAQPASKVSQMSKHTLILTRELKASPEQLYRCWTEPELIPHYFCPLPWRAEAVALDPRPGGKFHTRFFGPEGEEINNPGQYILVESNRIVFTDAFVGDWVASENPFMVGEVRFDRLDDGTCYTATAQHWSAEDMKRHEEMGFYEGWGIVAEQLDMLALTL